MNQQLNQRIAMYSMEDGGQCYQRVGKASLIAHGLQVCPDHGISSCVKGIAI